MAKQLDNALVQYNCNVYRTIDGGEGAVMVQLAHYPGESFLILWNCGWHPTKKDAINATLQHLRECKQMNVFQTRLFPYLEGLMIKDKPVTMTIRSVTQEEITGPRGAEMKIILHFKERPKSLILNKTNTKQIVKFFGPETDDWQGNKITLYAEEGTWFGNHGWAVRVDGRLPKQNGRTKKKLDKATEENLDDLEEIEQKSLLDNDVTDGAYDES